MPKAASTTSAAVADKVAKTADKKTADKKTVDKKTVDKEVKEVKDVKEVKEKKSAKKEVVSSTTAEAAPAAAATTTEVVAEDAPSADDFAALSASFVSNIQKVSALVTALKNEYRALEKSYARQLKAAQKSQGKRKRSTEGRSPSVFTEPTDISDDLADFLGIERGSKVARADVTSALNAYIVKNDLRQPDNKRIILPDAKLRALLKIDETVSLTYFNLQRYLTVVFPKKEVA
jgi:chromatin remodeling complex protein RSC6